MIKPEASSVFQLYKQLCLVNHDLVTWLKLEFIFTKALNFVFLYEKIFHLSNMGLIKYSWTTSISSYWLGDYYLIEKKNLYQKKISFKVVKIGVK